MKRACVITEELDRGRVGVPNGTRLVDDEIRIGDLVESGTRQTFFVETQIRVPVSNCCPFGKVGSFFRC